MVQNEHVPNRPQSSPQSSNTVVTMSKMLAPTALRWPRMANAMGMPGNDVLVQVPAER